MSKAEISFTQLPKSKKKSQYHKMFPKVAPGARPLKCKLCSRRFKYMACMKDHIKSDHKPELLLYLVKKRVQQNRLRVMKQILSSQARLHQKSPIIKKSAPAVDRVSVIQKNSFNSPFSISNLLHIA